ncbi:MAG: HAMP domain-containing histidine kinase [Proteobacteria bacterium]|nr:HAMP domain-containing histidine kinase [Pseudomonadota bacterium]
MLLRIEMTGIALSPHLPAAVRADGAACLPDSAEASAWMNAFFRGRIAVLGLAFAVLPLALAVAPEFVNSVLPVVLAAILMATFGLVGQRYGSAPGAMAGSAIGMASLAMAPWLGGLAGATAAIGCVALALEAVAMPVDVRRARLAPLALLLSALLILATGFAAQGAPVPQVQAVLAALVLPLAPLMTLALMMRAAQLALATERRSADAQTRREASLAAALDVAVIVLDRTAQVRDFTDAALGLVGGGRGDLVGRGLFDRVLIADRPVLLKAVSEAVLAGCPARFSLHVSDAPPTDATRPPRFQRYHAVVRPGAEGAHEATLRLELAQGEEPATECRAGLFASLSHEIRTPMNAILGFSEILANPALQPKTVDEVAEYAGIIHKSALGAFAVTRAVVDLLRVESTDFRLEPETVDLAEFSTTIIAGLAEKSDCRLETAPGNYSVEADPRCIRMMLTNIVEGFANAGLCAPVVLRLNRRGNGATFAITCASEARGGHLGHAAYLGVVEALVRRIAGLTGWQVSILTSGSALTASLSVPVSGDIAKLHPAPAAGNTTHPLRKIA